MAGTVLKQASDYRSRLRRIALAYYNGEIGFLEFRAQMTTLIAGGMGEAWQAGKVAVGKTGSLNFGERLRIWRQVANELRYVWGLADDIARFAR